MFDISFSELLVIGVVALVVIGPERLPKVARTAGHLFSRLQRYVAGVKADIAHEMELDELRKFKHEIEDAAHLVKSVGQREISLAAQEIKVLRQTAEKGIETVDASPVFVDSEPSPQMELPLDVDSPPKQSDR